MQIERYFVRVQAQLDRELVHVMCKDRDETRDFYSFRGAAGG